MELSFDLLGDSRCAGVLVLDSCVSFFKRFIQSLHVFYHFAYMCMYEDSEGPFADFSRPVLVIKGY